MKKVFTILLAFTLLFSFTSAAYAGDKTVRIHEHKDDWNLDLSSLNKCHIEDVAIELDGKTIYINHEFEVDDEIEINRDYELFLNGDQIDLNEDQQALVTEFYETTVELQKFAKKIGWEGAKIGVEGAKLGIKAIGGLFKMLFTSYDEDDFEDDMDREAKVIEAKAERLEKKAEVIEEMAYELEDLTIELFDQIPELKKLDWIE